MPFDAARFFGSDGGTRLDSTILERCFRKIDDAGLRLKMSELRNPSNLWNRSEWLSFMRYIMLTVFATGDEAEISSPSTHTISY